MSDASDKAPPSEVVSWQEGELMAWVARSRVRPRWRRGSAFGPWSLCGGGGHGGLLGAESTAGFLAPQQREYGLHSTLANFTQQEVTRPRPRG